MKWLWVAAFWMQNAYFQAFPPLAPSDILTPRSAPLVHSFCNHPTQFFTLTLCRFDQSRALQATASMATAWSLWLRTPRASASSPIACVRPSSTIQSQTLCWLGGTVRASQLFIEMDRFCVHCELFQVVYARPLSNALNQTQRWSGDNERASLSLIAMWKIFGLLIACVVCDNLSHILTDHARNHKMPWVKHVACLVV